MLCTISFEENEFAWLHHDDQTDFWKFRVEHDIAFTDAEVKRIADAMISAGKKEMSKIICGGAR